MEAKVSILVTTQPMPPLNQAPQSLTTDHCSSGRSGLRPSLVQGLRPRNAPAQNHASPTVRRHSSCAPHPKWRPPANTRWDSLNGGADKRLLKTDTVCGSIGAAALAIYLLCRPNRQVMAASRLQTVLRVRPIIIAADQSIKRSLSQRASPQYRAFPAASLLRISVKNGRPHCYLRSGILHLGVR